MTPAGAGPDRESVLVLIGVKVRVHLYGYGMQYGVQQKLRVSTQLVC